LIQGVLAVTVTLTPDLARAIAGAKGETIRLKDPATNEDYVLVRAELYDRIAHLVTDDDDGLNMAQVGMLIQQVMREDDENDPLLASYQNYTRKQ
jgi:hypothetical protein